MLTGTIITMSILKAFYIIVPTLLPYVVAMLPHSSSLCMLFYSMLSKVTYIVSCHFSPPEYGAWESLQLDLTTCEPSKLVSWLCDLQDVAIT